MKGGGGGVKYIWTLSMLEQLSALCSSRRLVVCLLVCQSVCWSVCQRGHQCSVNLDIGGPADHFFLAISAAIYPRAQSAWTVGVQFFLDLWIQGQHDLHFYSSYCNKWLHGS